MTAIRRFLGRPGADRALLLHALALHGGIGLLVRLIAHQRLMRWLAAAYAHAPARRAEVGRIVWAVRTATTVVPAGKSCLTEALTAQSLLRRHGYAATLRIGVARGAGTDQPIAAHAWLEYAGRIVVGGDAAARYQPLRASGTE